MIDFGTIATAMVTPFDINGNIDFAKTTKLVNYLIDNGTTAIVVGGTTGESPTLGLTFNQTTTADQATKISIVPIVHLGRTSRKRRVFIQSLSIK